MERIHVATLNIRNLADRWHERLPLLLADMSALQPDVMGMQECVYPMQQDRVIGAAGETHYTIHRGWAGRPEYGNSLLVRHTRTTTDVERLDLGHNRSALRASVVLAGGARLLAVVTHLHHVPADESIRAAQATELLRWVDGDSTPQSDAQVIVGDFNAEPVEPTYTCMTDAGFSSAYAAANGREPDVTWPSGLQGPAIDTDGDPGCLDYIWVRGAVRVRSARVVFDRPDPDDPGLFPSDHFGLSAQLTVGGGE
jgi:endonuclease/exonuclease/phosphatase family metal-dependent hydrolase